VAHPEALGLELQEAAEGLDVARAGVPERVPLEGIAPGKGEPVRFHGWPSWSKARTAGDDERDDPERSRAEMIWTGGAQAP
jgi:hypothetical protein